MATPKFLVVSIKDDAGNDLGSIVAQAKDFSTGSKGFYGNGKVGQGVIGEKGLQCSLNLVIIGSKPKA